MLNTVFITIETNVLQFEIVKICFKLSRDYIGFVENNDVEFMKIETLKTIVPGLQIILTINTHEKFDSSSKVANIYANIELAPNLYAKLHCFSFCKF